MYSFLFIHSIDTIWLLVVWERPFLFSLIATCTSEMRVEAKQITDGIHWRISGWLRSSNRCLYFPPHVFMLIEPWRTRSAEWLDSIHLVCSVKPHIVSQIIGVFFFFPASLIHAPEVRALYFRLEISSKRDVVFEGVWQYFGIVSVFEKSVVFAYLLLW